LVSIRSIVLNVKALASSGLAPEAIPEGQLGVVDISTNQTVALSDFASLPDEFVFISKINGKVLFSLDTIKKSTIKNYASNAYQAEAVNIWQTTIENCDCINGFQLNVNIDEASLMQRDGLTWAHRDFVVDVAPEELTCKCACDGKNPTYENNVITEVLADKVNALESPFYEAEVNLDVSGVTAVADADSLPGTPDQGDLVIQEDTDELKMYDGSAWVVVGTDAGLITDVATFIAINEAVNTDGDEATDGPKLIFVLKGKPQPAPIYNDLEVNYVYPRGVKLHPAIMINGVKAITFSETQALQHELGAGYDLRAEEFDSISLYTDVNFYPQLSDGIKNPKLVYQFENNTNYNTVSFEFDTQKVRRAGEADQKRFAVTLGTANGSIFSTIDGALNPNA
jgi:hypothetical protein